MPQVHILAGGKGNSPISVQELQVRNSLGRLIGPVVKDNQPGDLNRAAGAMKVLVNMTSGYVRTTSNGKSEWKYKLFTPAGKLIRDDATTVAAFSSIRGTADPFYLPPGGSVLLDEKGKKRRHIKDNGSGDFAYTIKNALHVPVISGRSGTFIVLDSKGKESHRVVFTGLGLPSQTLKATNATKPDFGAAGPVALSTLLRQQRKLLVNGGEKLAAYLHLRYPKGVSYAQAKALIPMLNTKGLTLEAQSLAKIMTASWNVVTRQSIEGQGNLLEAADVKLISRRSLLVGLTTVQVSLDGRDRGTSKLHSINENTQFEYSYFDKEFNRSFTLPIRVPIKNINRDGAGTVVISLPVATSGELRVFSRGSEAAALAPAGDSSSLADDFSVKVSDVGRPGFTLGGVVLKEQKPRIYSGELTPTLDSSQQTYVTSFQVAMSNLISKMDDASLLLSDLGTVTSQTPSEAFETAANKLRTVDQIFLSVKDAKEKLDEAVEDLVIKDVPALFFENPLKRLGRALTHANTKVLTNLEILAVTLSTRISKAKKLEEAQANQHLLNCLFGLAGALGATGSVYFGLRDVAAQRKIYQNRAYWFGQSLDNQKGKISAAKQMLASVTDKESKLQNIFDNPLSPPRVREKARADLAVVRAEEKRLKEEISELGGAELDKKQTKVWETDEKLKMTSRALWDTAIGVGLMGFTSYELYKNYNDFTKPSNFPGVDPQKVRSTFDAVKKLWLDIDNQWMQHTWERIPGYKAPAGVFTCKEGPEVDGYVRTRWIVPNGRANPNTPYLQGYKQGK